MPTDATIKVIVKEKGMQHSAGDNWLSRVGQNLAAGVMLVEEAAMGEERLGSAQSIHRGHVFELYPSESSCW